MYKELWQMLKIYLLKLRDVHEKGTPVSSISEDNWTVVTCENILKKMINMEKEFISKENSNYENHT